MKPALPLLAALALLPLSLLSPRAALAAACNCTTEQCLAYEREVTVIGRLSRSEGTPPNGVVDHFEILTVARAVCAQRTAPGPAPDGDDNIDEPGQTELQLHVPDEAVRRQLAALVSAGHRVELRGRVWHGQTAHHHRPLVFTVTAVTALRR